MDERAAHLPDRLITRCIVASSRCATRNLFARLSFLGANAQPVATPLSHGTRPVARANAQTVAENPLCIKAVKPRLEIMSPENEARGGSLPIGVPAGFTTYPGFATLYPKRPTCKSRDYFDNPFQPLWKWFFYSCRGGQRYANRFRECINSEILNLGNE